jgi:hypothetical protein
VQYRPVFDGSWTIRGNITDAQKEEMKNRLEDGFGYVE